MSFYFFSVLEVELRTIPLRACILSTLACLLFVCLFVLSLTEFCTFTLNSRSSTGRSVILLLQSPYYPDLRQFTIRSGCIVVVLSWLTANYVRRLLLFVTWVIFQWGWCSTCLLNFYTIYCFNIFCLWILSFLHGSSFCKDFFFSIKIY